MSRVAKTLDAAVAAYHTRPITRRYKALILDGVVLSRNTGAGAIKRPVLVDLGIRKDGRKAVRTANAIKRRFRKVRRRIRPKGVFSDKTRMDRILIAVFIHEYSKEGTGISCLTLK